MTRGVVQIAAGLALGLGLALATTGVMEPLLFGMVPHDPTVLSAASAVLIAVGLVACWLPAWRAARILPTRALAHEERT
jgi:ABC-type antimicrobial peptide transport system permease subunit